MLTLSQSAGADGEPGMLLGSAAVRHAMRPLRPSNADSDESSATRGAATRSRIVGALEALIDRYRPFREGRVADYIPELAKADPDWFAISIVTVDGVAYEVGDHAREYTIQSMSKPF